ncbi:hypothetical protein [Gordonibacter massiliensis (ex Traore et al. 2017)]|uniref:hypothetical protein n=1 Tax=Gordonibacter massiliensis (ex Traore et al. 2017) TaxID=1841863 RepID=UPI001C8BB37F|nr:hypothetical protein [Gordonibacter massiliensis (ex Traore et al. 2017)]MBX9033827.1 hypothetical protein [Gordonibacter massiliensis (ex Traore et al. 2017)]
MLRSAKPKTAIEVSPQAGTVFAPPQSIDSRSFEHSPDKTGRSIVFEEEAIEKEALHVPTDE